MQSVPSPTDIPPGPDAGGVQLLRLRVDDGGEWLIVLGGPVVIGHARAEECDLPFLADVPPACAELSREASLRDGPGWRVRPLAGATVRVAGEPLGDEGRRLADGDRVRFAANLALRHRLPDPASESAVLELEGGAECLGAGRVVLAGAGMGGRLRLGAGARRHVPLERGGCEASLIALADRIAVACPDGVRAGDHAGPVVELPLPLGGRVDFALGRRGGASPPLLLSLEPAAERGRKT
jgi:hypothetical protein